MRAARDHKQPCTSVTDRREQLVKAHKPLTQPNMALKRSRKEPAFSVLPNRIMESLFETIEPRGTLLVYDYSPGIRNTYEATVRAGVQAGFAAGILDSCEDYGSSLDRTGTYLKFTK